MTPLRQIRQKLFLKEALLLQVQAWKADGQRIVFTNGCFDILHPGHVDYLARAASLGDKLIIAVNTDASVQKLKGPHRPIQSEEARTFILAALGFTSAIVLFGEDTPAQIISEILPDVLVKGADYAIDAVVGADTVAKNGGSIVLLPYLPGYSTTAIERKIREA